MKKISQFDWPTRDTSFHGKQISVHTRELAPETDSCNRFDPGACSLLSNQFDMREQNSGAKVLLRNIFFSLEIVGADNGSFALGACCRSVLREQAPSCVRALTFEITMARSKPWTILDKPMRNTWWDNMMGNNSVISKCNENLRLSEPNPSLFWRHFVHRCRGSSLLTVSS